MKIGYPFESPQPWIYKFIIPRRELLCAYVWNPAVKRLVPLYVPVGVALGTAKPQKISCWTLEVLVGDVRRNPETLTGLAVSAVEVPG